MSRAPDPSAKIMLLRSAEDVFAEKGLAAAKVQDITARAGMSKGSFYLHFESKEEAFHHVVESFIARCIATCSLVPGDPIVPRDGDPSGVLSFWHARDVEMLEFFWQNRGIMSILPTCINEEAYLLETFKDSMHKNCIAWMEAWKKQHLLRDDIDSELAASLLQGVWQELLHKMLKAQQKPPFADWSRQVQSILVRGLGAPALISALTPRASTRVVDRSVITSERRRRPRP